MKRFWEGGRWPHVGEEFVWDFADPAGAWHEMTETVADVIGRAGNGWRVEFGMASLAGRLPSEMLRRYADLRTPRMGSTVVVWSEGRLVRESALARRPSGASEEGTKNG